VRLTVAWWRQLRGLGVMGELDALMNVLLGQSKARSYKAKQKQDAGQLVLGV
jgi:hypothetical protein